MPISGTHSIVGATIGFSIVLRGWESIKWMAMARIVASWFASPILSGFISSLIYLLISKTVIRKVDPLKYGLKTLPLFYGATIFINVASVVISGPEVLGLSTLSWYTGLFISLVIAAGVICCVAMLLVPKLRRQILDEIITKSSHESKAKHSKTGQQHTTSLSSPPSPASKDKLAYDNVAFKSDSGQTGPISVQQDQPKTLIIGQKPKVELTLDVNQLAMQSIDSPPVAPTSTVSGRIKPPIAQKPAHLQKYPPAVQDPRLEEIDLDPPAIKKPKRLDIENGGAGGHDGPSNGRPGMIRGERLEVFRLFSSLQILTACFASFAHGTNDVSNAVAPLIPIWNIYTTGIEDISQQTQIWILAFGGIGICTGLWAWGRAVMCTVGDGLTQLTPSKGFAIELGAAISVLCATKLGLPISTTHCKVGSVVIVGLVSSKFCSQDNLLDMTEAEMEAESGKSAVDWKLFGNIAITWIVTVPMAALASALLMVILRWLAL